MAVQDNVNYFDGLDEGFTSGLSGMGMTEDAYGALSPDAKLDLSNSFANGSLNSAGNSFGLGGIGEALGSGWDMLKGGLDTVSGLASLYMDWDKLQSTKASARDTHNANATKENNYLNRARSASASMGLPTSAGGYSRSNIKKSTV